MALEKGCKIVQFLRALFFQGPDSPPYLRPREQGTKEGISLTFLDTLWDCPLSHT